MAAESNDDTATSETTQEMPVETGQPVEVKISKKQQKSKRRKKKKKSQNKIEVKNDATKNEEDKVIA
jgi:hypothetical protein